MRPWFGDFLAFVVTVAAGLALGQFDPRIPAYLDAPLLFVLRVAARGELVSGLVAGVLSGWVADTLQGGPYGLLGSANTVVGFAVARLAQLLVLERRLFQLALFSAAVAGQGALVALLLALFREPTTTVDPLQLAIRTAVTAPIAVLWLALERSFKARLAQRRPRGRPIS